MLLRFIYIVADIRVPVLHLYNTLMCGCALSCLSVGGHLGAFHFLAFYLCVGMGSGGAQSGGSDPRVR